MHRRELETIARSIHNTLANCVVDTTINNTQRHQQIMGIQTTARDLAKAMKEHTPTFDVEAFLRTTGVNKV